VLPVASKSGCARSVTTPSPRASIVSGDQRAVDAFAVLLWFRGFQAGPGWTPARRQREASRVLDDYVFCLGAADRAEAADAGPSGLWLTADKGRAASATSATPRDTRRPGRCTRGGFRARRPKQSRSWGCRPASQSFGVENRWRIRVSTAKVFATRNISSCPRWLPNATSCAAGWAPICLVHRRRK